MRRVSQHSVLHAVIRAELTSDWLAERLGPHHSWDVDLDRAAFAYDNGTEQITARAQLIASLAEEPATLVWGWTPPFAHWQAPDSDIVRLRQVAERAGLSELTTPEIPYPYRPGVDDQAAAIAAFSHEVGGAAIELLGPSFDYYSAPTGPARRMVLLLDRWSEPVPQVTPEAVFQRLPRLAAGVDDLAWSLDGLVQLLPGWGVRRLPDPRPQPGTAAAAEWELTSADGRFLTLLAEWDQRGRVVRTQESGIHPARS